jgi:hypothetical protein
VFVISQFSEVVHLPITNYSDIQALDKSGEREYIFVPNADKELKAHSIEFLQSLLNEGTIPAEMESQFTALFDIMMDDSYSFEDILMAMENDETVHNWLLACKGQFSERFGNVDEVNSNIQNSLNNKGYSPVLYAKYVTYMQIVTALLIFPIFLLLFTRDYRHNMYETIYTQPLSSTQYLLCRFWGAFLPLATYLYIAGLALNCISFFRFAGVGFNYSYAPFLPYYSFYLLPTVFFLSSLLTALMMFINKAVAVFPIYIVYVVFNVTPNAFYNNAGWINIINPIIRHDREIAEIGSLIMNRAIYLSAGILLLVIACRKYKVIRRNLRKVISI